MNEAERGPGEDLRDIELGAALRGAAEALAGNVGRAIGLAPPAPARRLRSLRPLAMRAFPVAAALAIAAASSITGVGLSRRAAVERASLELAQLLLPAEGAWLDGALAPVESGGDELMAFLLDLWQAGASGDQGGE